MVKRYQVRMVLRAAQDIHEICSYIERDSPQNSAAVAQALFDSIDSLELLPHRFRVHEHRTDPAKTVHAMPVSPFIVYYRVLERNDVVEVITVRHGARRQPRRIR